MPSCASPTSCATHGPFRPTWRRAFPSRKPTTSTAMDRLLHTTPPLWSWKGTPTATRPELGRRAGRSAHGRGGSAWPNWGPLFPATPRQAFQEPHPDPARRPPSGMARDPVPEVHRTPTHGGEVHRGGTGATAAVSRFVRARPTPRRESGRRRSAISPCGR